MEPMQPMVPIQKNNKIVRNGSTKFLIESMKSVPHKFSVTFGTV